jgi:hypothetical protein
MNLCISQRRARQKETQRAELKVLISVAEPWCVARQAVASKYDTFSHFHAEGALVSIDTLHGKLEHHAVPPDASLDSREIQGKEFFMR